MQSELAHGPAVASCGAQLMFSHSYRVFEGWNLMDGSHSVQIENARSKAAEKAHRKVPQFPLELCSKVWVGGKKNRAELSEVC